MPLAKKAALTLGKNALTAGAAVAQDVLDQRDVKTSFKENFKNAARTTGRDLLREFISPNQRGAGSVGLDPQPKYSLSESFNKSKKRKALKRRREQTSGAARQQSERKPGKRHIKHSDIFS